MAHSSGRISDVPVLEEGDPMLLPDPRTFEEALETGISNKLISVHARKTEQCADCRKIVLGGAAPLQHCKKCTRRCSKCDLRKELDHFLWDNKREDPKLQCRICMQATIKKNRVRPLISALARVP